MGNVGVGGANPIPTWGGADAESVQQGEKQISRYLQHRDRLVTKEDFVSITLRTTPTGARATGKRGCNASRMARARCS